MAAVPFDILQSDLDATPYSPESALDQLQRLSFEQPECHSNKLLLSSLQSQQNIIEFLQKDLSSTGVSISDTDAVLLAFLRSYYCTVSALPAALKWDALESAVAASRLVLPFIEGFSQDSGEMSVGVPSNGDALADTVSELVRVAAAAIICRFHFFHHQSSPDSHPSDEALLIFTSIGVKSCTQAENASRLTAQLQALQSKLPSGGEASITLPQIRWLMHYLRAEILATYAQSAGVCVTHSIPSRPSSLLLNPLQVQQLLGNEPQLQETLAARRAECLSLLKSVPSNPAGYILLTRSCLQLNQPQAALLFADKAISVATNLHDHHANAQLQLIRATALALGGGRSSSGSSLRSHALQATAECDSSLPTLSSASTNTPPAAPAVSNSAGLPGLSGVWTSAEVWDCVHSSRESMQRLRASLPTVYHSLLNDSLQPEQRVVSHFVLGPAGPLTSSQESSATGNTARAEGSADKITAEDGFAAAISGLSQLGLGDEHGVSDTCERQALRMLYTTPPVRSLPPGMLLQGDDEEEQEEIGGQ